MFDVEAERGITRRAVASELNAKSNSGEDSANDLSGEDFLEIINPTTGEFDRLTARERKFFGVQARFLLMFGQKTAGPLNARAEGIALINNGPSEQKEIFVETTRGKLSVITDVNRGLSDEAFKAGKKADAEVTSEILVGLGGAQIMVDVHLENGVFTAEMFGKHHRKNIYDKSTRVDPDTILDILTGAQPVVEREETGDSRLVDKYLNMKDPITQPKNSPGYSNAKKQAYASGFKYRGGRLVQGR